MGGWGPKINKWNLIKLEDFCTAKETVDKMKRPPLKWEKMITNEVTDMGLLCKIHKQFMWLNNRKTNNPIKKMVRTPEESFLQIKYKDGQ